MANFFDYYFSSVVPTEEQHDGDKYLVVDFSRPGEHKINGFPDFPVMLPSIAEPFITAQQYLDFAQLKPGGVVLDLGAYSALTSIAFSKAVGPEGSVLAFEPDPINYKAAFANIDTHRRVNNLDNIKLVNSAVMPETGTCRFSSEGSMGSADVSVVGDYRGKIVEVESQSLIDIVKNNALNRVDFIKMDIEGPEADVLAASSDFFLRFKPRVIIEPHSVKGVLTTEAVIKTLESYGYSCDIIEQIGITNLPLVTAEPRHYS